MPRLLAPVTEPDARPRCPRCGVAAVACACATIRRVAIPHRLVVLMHPGERARTINTGRFVPLVLEDARRVVGRRFDAPELDSLTRGAPYLVYPRADALAPAAIPPGPATFFLVDGTWSQARAILRDSPALRSLPAVRLDPEFASRYGAIRHQPGPGLVCLAEAAIVLLDALGQPDAARALALPLAHLIAFQERHKSAGTGRSRHRR